MNSEYKAYPASFSMWPVWWFTVLSTLVIALGVLMIITSGGWIFVSEQANLLLNIAVMGFAIRLFILCTTKISYSEGVVTRDTLGFKRSMRLSELMSIKRKPRIKRLGGNASLYPYCLTNESGERLYLEAAYCSELNVKRLEAAIQFAIDNSIPRNRFIAWDRQYTPGL